MPNIYLVSEIDFSRGFGHIIRLNNLASNFQSQKKIFFLLKKKNKFNDNVLDYPLINFNEKNTKRLLNERNAIFILDIAVINKRLKLFFEKISKLNIVIVIFHKKINYIKYDYLIIPHITKSEYKDKNIIYGRNSLIFNKEILKRDKEKKNKKFVLYINMGASDNENFTLKVLKNLKYFYNDRKFVIKVLKGPFYKSKLKRYLKSIERQASNIKILSNQKNYIKNMKNISFAIINSGNIKYEIAKLGKPFILISNDPLSTKFCNYFINYLYCIKFKSFKVPNETFIKKYILKLIKNKREINKFKKNKIVISSKKIENLCKNLQK